jgi:transporter family protein
LLLFYLIFRSETPFTDRKNKSHGFRTINAKPDAIKALPAKEGSVQFLSTWQFFALASAFFASLTAIFGKIGVSDINSNLATFLRTIVILIVTAGIVTLRSEWQKPENLPHRSVIFLVLSALATGASWLCYYRALQLGPAAKVAPVDKLSVVFTMILAFVFLHEAFTWKTLLGGLLIVSGAMVLAL